MESARDDDPREPAGEHENAERKSIDELVDEYAGYLDERSYQPGYLDDERTGWR